MSRGRWPGIVIVTELIAFGALHVTGLVLASLGLFIVYLISCRLNPRVRHTSGFRHCNGSGEIQGWLFSRTFHKCPGCAGGRQIRWGARFLGLPHVQAEHDQAVTARRMAKDRGTWR